MWDELRVQRMVEEEVTIHHPQFFTLFPKHWAMYLTVPPMDILCLRYALGGTSHTFLPSSNLILFF